MLAKGRSLGGSSMREFSGLFLFAAILIAPIGARSETGMASMQYYVGTWTCTGGEIGEAATTATLTYTLDDGVLRQWVNVPVQGKMKKPYVLNSTTTYDVKNSRYVQAGLDSNAAWWISYAKPWSGDRDLSPHDIVTAHD